MFKFAKAMKDIQYFINIETEFCNTPEPKMYYNQELGEFTIPNEPLGFLRKQSFTLCAKPGFDDSHRYNTHFKQYGLTDVEILILRCFYGNISGAFRDDYYNGKIPAIAQEMQHVLDSLILFTKEGFSIEILLLTILLIFNRVIFICLVIALPPV